MCYVGVTVTSWWIRTLRLDKSDGRGVRRSGRQCGTPSQHHGDAETTFLVIGNVFNVGGKQRVTGALFHNNYNSFRSEEHTSELQSRGHLVCRLLLEKKKTREQAR